MIRINQLTLQLDESEAKLKIMVAKALKVEVSRIERYQITKKAVDARKKERICFICSVDVEITLPPNSKTTKHACEERLVTKVKNPQISLVKPYEYILPQAKPHTLPPVVVGAGPAGLFAALILAEAGLKPILLERGKPAAERLKDVNQFWQKGILNLSSNVQFGEGGAGTFSDGKLTTNTKDMRNRKVINEFIEAGAPPEIAYLAKPHIGTDKLVHVVIALRQKIIALGGTVLFEHTLTGLAIHNNSIEGLTVQTAQGKKEIAAKQVILAVGHSARDTYRMLVAAGINMQAKPFSLGARIEHSQKLINLSQYGAFAEHPALGAADYKLFCHLPNGHSVYTFCMCPGGVVVAAASQEGGIVTNGMSYHRRDGATANSALLVNVDPEDFGTQDPLAGIALQEQIEHTAYKLGGSDYKAPCQLVEDFLAGRQSTALGNVQPTYKPSITLSDISLCLPDFVTESMRLALPILNKKLKGFAAPDALLTAPETRSSAPLRIIRNEKCESITNLYPCGEGAGYAGGIISAAVDGIRCAEALMQK
ncbi:MAG: FAD-binding protein [Clostridia bacterium]|nr:FAD-binding protein [Clostridia bacterium]